MQIKELGHVVLFVTDVEKLSHFYRETLGFKQVVAGPGMAMFSGGRTHHELLLLEVGGETEKTKQAKPGLYHIGFKVADSHEELKAVYEELLEKKVTIIGTTNHHITHSIYILDPDSNELELYADVSEDWKKDPTTIARPAQPLSF